MANYWVSFRINDSDKKATYDDRRKSVVKAVKDMSKLTWEDTTSLIMFETEEEDIDIVTRKLVGKLLPDFDLIVVRKIDHKISRLWGKLNDAEIVNLMPGIKRVK